MRVVGIDLAAPAALANVAIISLLQGAIDGDRLNWLLRFDEAAAVVRTANGLGTASGAFVAEGEVHALDARIDGTTWSTAPATGTLRLDVSNDDGSLLTTLPIDALQFDGLAITDDGTCIGSRSGRRWILPARFGGSIRVSEARAVFIEALGMDLCSLLAGSFCDMPASTWMHPPDVVCSGGTECSAWTIAGSLAAAATPVEGL